MTQRTVDFRYAPPRTWTCIGRPDDPFKTLIDERGRLLYDFQRQGARYGTFRFGRVVSFAVHSAAQPLTVTQETESARAPIVVTRIAYPHATLTLRAAGHQHDGGLRTDIVLWQIDIADGREEIVSGLWLDIQGETARFAPAGRAPSAFVYAHAPEDMPQWRGLDDLFAVHADVPPTAVGRAPFLVSTAPLQVASAFDHGPSSGLRTEFAFIHGDAPYRGALCFPQNHSQVEGIDLAWAEDALAAERRFWNGYKLLPDTLSIPDDGIMEMLTACARNILQAREIKDGLPEFQVGPTVYRGLWIIDGYFFLEAAQFMDRPQEAWRGIDALLRRVRPNGAIEERSLDTKDTGLALATIVRQCELMHDSERLRELWPTLRRAVDYVRSLHEDACQLPEDDPAHGLLPASFANGGLGGIRAEYTTVLWMMVGVQAVARAAIRLGLTDEADEINAFFTKLYTALREHAERDQRVRADGVRFLPMLKPGSGAHHWIHNFPGDPLPWEQVNPGTGTWAFAHAVYPGQLFAPDDPLLQDFCQLLDHLDDAEGIPAATGWLPFEALWSYAASFYAHVWLYVGRPDKAVDYLYAFANHASPTRVWREEQSLAAVGLDQQIGDMPHNWASAEFIRLVRNLLVFERGDVLELLPGLPAEWIVAGRALSIATPTPHGTVHLSLTVGEDNTGDLHVKIDGPPTAQAIRVRIHRPRAPGFRLRALTVQDEVIDLSAPSVRDVDVVDVLIGGR
ncbi:MAG: hypothetical protein KDD84_08190 [Caldilineaceae bacterium]|nr:hypothetical protein [Caldilineaceae bacterium]